MVLCDDLSFEVGDTADKALKAALEGGSRARPSNVLFFATSNRRHLMPRDTIETGERDQGGRGGRGGSVAFRPLRPLARLPSLQPGRLPRDGPYNAKHFQPEPTVPIEFEAEALEWATRGGPIGPHGLAVHPGSGRPARQAARRDGLTLGELG